MARAAVAVVSRVGVGLLVRLVLQRFFQRDEPVAALLDHIGHRTEVIRVDRVGVHQQDVIDVASHQPRGRLLGERELLVVEAQIVGGELRGQLLVALAHGRGATDA